MGVHVHPRKVMPKAWMECWGVGGPVVLPLRCILQLSGELVNVTSEILLSLVWDGAQALGFLG